MRDDSTIRVYQTPSEFAEAQTKKFGINDVLGGYQLNQKMKEIRSALAEGDYMAEKSRRINLYSVSLRSDVDHHIKGNQENDIVNGEMIGGGHMCSVSRYRIKIPGVEETNTTVEKEQNVLCVFEVHYVPNLAGFDAAANPE